MHDIKYIRFYSMYKILLISIFAKKFIILRTKSLHVTECLIVINCR